MSNLRGILFLSIASIVISGCSKSLEIPYHYQATGDVYHSHQSNDVDSEYFYDRIIENRELISVPDCDKKGLEEAGLLLANFAWTIREDSKFSLIAHADFETDELDLIFLNRKTCMLFEKKVDIDRIIGLGDHELPNRFIDDISPDLRFAIIRVWGEPYVPLLVRRQIYLIDLETEEYRKLSWSRNRYRFIPDKK